MNCNADWVRRETIEPLPGITENYDSRPDYYADVRAFDHHDEGYCGLP